MYVLYRSKRIDGFLFTSFKERTFSCTSIKRNKYQTTKRVTMKSSFEPKYAIIIICFFLKFQNSDSFTRIPQQSRQVHSSHQGQTCLRFTQPFTKSTPTPFLNNFAYKQKLTRLMKRAPSPKIEDISLGDEGKIPANLSRKVSAKRPSLGHVVPKKSKNQKRGGSSSPTLRAQGKAREKNLNNPANLKILGGQCRGRKLYSPDVYLRPMMGKVREAVYSTFTSFGLYDVPNVGGGDTENEMMTAPTRHLDIFAGSGSVGLESLSRGAAHCTFVDLAQNCCETVERNLELLQLEDRGNVRCCDVYDALLKPYENGIEGTFDIITLCPPYEEIVYADLLSAVANSPTVRDDTIILVEYPVELGSLPHVLNRDVEGDEGKLIGVRNRKYGRTVIALYIANPTGYLEVAESRPEEFIF